MSADELRVRAVPTHPDTYVQVADATLLVCGQRYLGAVRDPVIAQRIADLLNDHGLAEPVNAIDLDPGGPT